MLSQMDTASQRLRIFRCHDLRNNESQRPGIDSRHEDVPGFDQSALAGTTCLFIGAGGLNGETAHGAVMKGLGKITILDGDTVDVTNLNRQRFRRDGLGKNKAVELGKNLATDGHMGSEIFSYPMYFQEALEQGYEFDPDVIVCGVDNDQTRVFASRYALQHDIPILFSAVSRDANHSYAFIQECGKACFGCAFLDAVSNEVQPCPGVPAVIDALKTVSGLILYGLDTLLMNRKRDWNYRTIHLAGFMPDLSSTVDRRSDCPLCGQSQRGS